MAVTLVKSIWLDKEFNNDYGRKCVKELFGAPVIDFPKSPFLIQRVVSIASGPSDIVLDFFAGSGTTGQAVLQANEIDDGNRKFIMCTNNENNICETVTYPRIKNLIKGYEVNGKKTTGIKANLQYYQTAFK